MNLNLDNHCNRRSIVDQSHYRRHRQRRRALKHKTTMATAEDDDIALDGLFTVSIHNTISIILRSTSGSFQQEPPRPPSPEPTVFTYTRPPNSQRPLHTESHPKVPSDLASSNWSRLKIKLVGSHPLWGHHLFVYHLSLAIQPSLTSFQAKMERRKGIRRISGSEPTTVR